MKFTDRSCIPEEYIDQITQLIESNDENNWDIVHQLFIGWLGSDIMGSGSFYNLMMYYYQDIRHSRIENKWTLLDKINMYARTI